MKLDFADLDLVAIVKNQFKTMEVFRTKDLARLMNVESRQLTFRLNRIKNKDLLEIRIVKAANFSGNFSWYFLKVEP